MDPFVGRESLVGCEWISGRQWRGEKKKDGLREKIVFRSAGDFSFAEVPRRAPAPPPPRSREFLLSFMN